MNKKDENRIIESLNVSTQINQTRRLGLADKAKVEIRERIKSLFLDSTINDLFDGKFEEAISGSGDELFKMDAPWSSSLCALLFFYGVNENNKLTIGDTEYSESFFEVKNEVYKAPSNMDVVLRGEKNGRKKLLFIECKFSEYLDTGKYDISDEYLKCELFKDLLSNNDGNLTLKNLKKRKGNGYYYQAQYQGKDIFTYGIKQIIAHTIGLTNYKNGVYSQKRYSIEDDRYHLYNKDEYDVQFIEVIFDLKDKFKEQFNNYHNAVNCLMKKIKTVDVLPPTTYKKILELQENKGYKIDTKVKEYYKY